MVSYYHDGILADDDLANYDNDFDIVQDDDFILTDGDDSVCDNDQDGLTPEEAEAYENECKASAALYKALKKHFGAYYFHKWCKLEYII